MCCVWWTLWLDLGDEDAPEAQARLQRAKTGKPSRPDYRRPVKRKPRAPTSEAETSCSPAHCTPVD
jgi:hypothetical protein